MLLHGIATIRVTWDRIASPVMTQREADRLGAMLAQRRSDAA
jgi:hypothetical protein